MHTPVGLLARTLPGLLAIGLLAASGAVFAAAWRQSDTVESTEARAIATLRAIGAAERAWMARDGTPASITDLLSEPSAWANEIEALRGERHELGIWMHDGYCFAVYRCDREGEPLRDRRSKAPTVAGFFLAYAWPETWGETGRRVFVVDPSPGVRAWDHGLELISGTTSPPPAWLAMPREGDAYPFARSARGWQKKIRWQEVDAP